MDKHEQLREQLGAYGYFVPIEKIRIWKPNAYRKVETWLSKIQRDPGAAPPVFLVHYRKGIRG